MISELVRPGVKRLVENSEKVNRTIAVIPNTPLDHLVTEVIPVVTPTPGLEDEAVYQAADVTDITGINRHEMVMDEVITTLGSGLAMQVNVIRNEILPMVRRITAAVVDSTNAVKLGEYVIEPFFLSEVHDNEVIMELLEPWANFTLEEVASPIGFQPMEEAALITQVQTGSSRLDELMAEMIGKHPAGWAQSIYEDYFGIKGVKKFKPFNNFKSMDEWLFIHFLCRSMADQPQEGSPLSLVEHNAYCAKLLAQTALGMYNTHRSWDTLRSLGTVVLSWPITTEIPTGDQPAIIQVIGDSYNNFLGAGGTPEILIGACVSDRPYIQSKLIEDAERYAHAYNGYKTRQNTYRETQLGGIVRERLYVEVSEEIKTLPECIFDQGLPIEKMLAILHTIVGKFNDSQAANRTYEVVREVVCKVIYGHTDAWPMLLEVDRVMTERQCKGREAIYYVVLNRIVDFWLSQTEVSYR